ncbi:MAG: fumarate reductase/succinate dehydrogenase flavoprotein subunit, partial [Acidobacteria bacterium]|nr:fumarate reductase/succinate dehydrogenase flavoprotein subunit [Acidobacteriota bacterium]
PAIDDGQVEAAARTALEPLDRQGSGEAPYQVQYELQDLMQNQVGIVRNDAELRGALEALQRLQERVKRVEAQGNREYNSGWHTALDLRNLMTVAEAVTRSAIERKESRGAHFREDHLGKDEEWGRTTLVIRQGDDGAMELRRETIPPPREDLQRIIDDSQKS